MSPHEKAVSALNQRLERLQLSLREATLQSAQQFLVQAIVVTISVAEALNDYIREVGTFARRRHAELKQANEALAAQHAEMLQSGSTLLGQLKANPTDRAIRKQIEAAQRNMAAVQKSLRRGANALQRDVAPSVAMIDELAENVRRLGEADQVDALKRVLKTFVAATRELYANHPDLPKKAVIDSGAWETAARCEIEQATGFHDAYARACFQALVAIQLMTLAVSENPARSAEEATTRANEAAALRIKTVAARFGAS
jgi:hypothetical protein